MSRNWLAVAAAEHVEIGRNAGFMQVGHGKATPLRRVQPGDRVVYYSPNRIYSPSHASRGKDRLQAFTAIGTVKQGALYQADMGFGFHPFRRDVAWHDAEPAPLALLQDGLAFTQDMNWGYRLRQGLIEISDADMTTIAEAMFTASAAPDRPANEMSRGSAVRTSDSSDRSLPSIGRSVQQPIQAFHAG
jgi:EVE domain